MPGNAGAATFKTFYYMAFTSFMTLRVHARADMGAS